MEDQAESKYLWRSIASDHADLSDALQSEFLHEVDDVGPGQKFFFELLDCHWEGG